MAEEAARDEKKPDATGPEASATKAASDSGKPEDAEAPAERGGMPDWLRFPLVLGIVGAISAASLAGVYGLTRERIEASKKVRVVKALRSILGERYAEPEEVGDVRRGGHYVVKKGKDGKDGKDRPPPGGEIVAYGVQVKCPGSYNTGEPVELLVVLDPRLDLVLGARVVKSAETPGLGERVKEAPSAISIAGRIAGREPRRRVVLKKKGGALVGEVEEKDGSVVVTFAAGETQSFSRDEVEVTDAPFPAAFLDQFTGIPVGKARLRADGGRVDAITGATVSSTAVTRGVEKAAKLLQGALKSRK